MTRAEQAAFNEGVKAALGAASMAADAIERLPTFKEGRQGFATAALREFAAAGEQMLLGEPGRAQEAPKEEARP
jgi:methyl coenzyme M reductase alpha subunit